MDLEANRMNSMFVRGRRVALLIALLSVLLVSFVASASAQDIAVTKSTNNTLVAADSDVSYDITVSTSTGSTGETTLTDAVPTNANPSFNMTFVSATVPDGWNCNLPVVGSGGTITCTHAADLPDESIFSFTFVFHVASGTPNGTVFVNTANITNSADTNSGNDMSSATVTVGEPPPPPPPPLAAHDVLISEFRLSGPNGSSDEYVELYCNRDVDCDISGGAIRNYNNGAVTGDPLGPGDISSTFPSNTIIPARHYLLVGDASPGAYSLSSYGQININIHQESVPDYFSDNEGLQFLSPGEPTVVDSVGFIGGGESSNFIEGTGLQRATSRPSDEYAYVRKRMKATNGLPQDTDNNANDFVLVSVTGNQHPGITDPPVLGAPGPQGLWSPRSYSNAQVAASLVEPAISQDAAPNRVRTGTGDSGTLSIRRTFTNTTNQTFDYISFRVIDITTLNSPITVEDQAQLRLVTSGDAETFTNSQSRTVNIRGTILEFDSGCGCEPAQPSGGGLNSTVYVNLSDPETESQIFIGPSESVDVQFLLNVYKAGIYRFYVYVEAMTAQAPPPDRALNATHSATPGRPSLSGSRSNMTNFRRTSRPSKKPKTRAPLQSTSTMPRAPGSSTSAANVSALTPRAFIINRPASARPKKSRKKIRLRRTSSALKVKAEAKKLAHESR